MVLEKILTDPSALLAKEFFLPFILVFTLLWATLSLVKIFSWRINFVLAFVVTVLTAMSPWFAFISQYVILIGPLTAVGIFLALFVVGGLVWAIGRGKEIYYTSAGQYKKIEHLNKELAKHQKKLAEARDRGDTVKVNKELAVVKRLEDDLKIESAKR